MKTLLALLLALGAAQAFAQARDVDAAKSRLAFVYTIDRKIAAEGRFPRFAARVVFDERQPEKGSIRIDIDIAAIDTGTPEGDAEAKRRAWFDAASFPRAGFLSSAIRRTGERRYEADGALSIKGSSRPVTIPFTVADGGDGGGGLVARGGFTLRRLMFGVGLGEWADVGLIADEVEVRFVLALGPPR